MARHAISLFLVVSLVIASFFFGIQSGETQTVADRPAGVAQESWLAISDWAGVELLDGPVPSVAQVQLPQGIERFVSGSLSNRSGRLWIATGDGIWVTVELSHSPRMVPLH